jgi:hypothetical protein
MTTPWRLQRAWGPSPRATRQGWNPRLEEITTSLARVGMNSALRTHGWSGSRKLCWRGSGRPCRVREDIRSASPTHDSPPGRRLRRLSLLLLCYSAPDRRARTLVSTRSATITGSSCSQALMTSQPAAVSRRSVSESRALLLAIFSGQYQELMPARRVPCSGQPCQKQPSINTATRAGPKTMSALRRSVDSGCRSTLKRRPRPWSARRTAISGQVSRVRCSCIRLRTPGVLAYEAPALAALRLRAADAGRPAEMAGLFIGPRLAQRVGASAAVASTHARRNASCGYGGLHRPSYSGGQQRRNGIARLAIA